MWYCNCEICELRRRVADKIAAQAKEQTAKITKPIEPGIEREDEQLAIEYDNADDDIYPRQSPNAIPDLDKVY